MRGVLAGRIVLLAAALASMSWAQSISSLQSSYIEGSPQNVTGVTSGSVLPGGGFELYINGAFNVNNFQSVKWLNLSTNVSTTLSTFEGDVNPTRITAFVPNALFATRVASPVQVRVTVQEIGGSASAIYTINPPLRPIQHLLPTGIVNVPYSTPYYTGGTAPFNAGQTSGTVPPGLTASVAAISGTPLQTGVFNFQTSITDFWGNQQDGDDILEIVAVPTITLVTPGNSAAGVGALTITVDGTNFVDSFEYDGETLAADEVLPNSQVLWKANGVLTPLATTFVSTTQLTAVVPGALLAFPAAAGIVVQQPGTATSQAFPFAVIGPTISTIVPTGVPAGSSATTLTVNGANFTVDDSDNVPTVTVNGIPLSTSFGNSGRLTATIPSSLLISPALSPTVTVSANQNPSSAGQTVTFTARVTTPTTGAPTGTVTFKDGATSISGNVAISGAGTATFTTSTLTAGSHSITAVYNGDANFAVNTSPALIQVVIAGNTAMTLEVSPTFPLVGTAATYKVTLTNATAPPQGSVTINEGPGAPLCSIASLTLGATGSTGTCSVAYNSADAPHSAGAHNLTAVFTPVNANWTATTALLSLNVVGATATAGKPSSSNGDTYDYGSVTTFTSIVGNPNPGNKNYPGVVNFYDGGVLIASATPGPSTGAATTPAVLLTAGSHSITAQYSGDFYYATSLVSAPLTVTVNVSAAKPYIVQVRNPGGAASNSLPFFVLPPGLSSLTTTAVSAGSPNLQLALTGVNFLSGSQVVFRGSTLTPSAVTSIALTVTVPAALLTAPGVVNVQVVNPGGTLSNSLPFSVLAPGLNTLQPAAIPVGSADFTLMAAGLNFVSGSQIVFNGTALPSMFRTGTLLAIVPSTLLTSAGVVNVSVTNPGSAAANTLPFSILSPSLSAISPTGAVSGTNGVSVVVTGTNFAPGSQVRFDGAALTTSFGSSTSLTAAIPFTLLGVPRVAVVTVANPGVSGNVTSGLPFTVTALLSIATTALPTGVTGTNYSAVLTAKGGTPPYTWSATGFPPALFMNASTGVISGLLQIGGTFTINVVVTDAARISVSASFALVIAPPPVAIPPNVGLPDGTVGVAYSGLASVSGGALPYTFSLVSGKLPDGLTLSPGGAVTGTPKTPGRFAFNLVVTDADGGTASRDTSITIRPAPLTIHGGPDTPPVVGTPTTITYTGSGGVPPYRFTPCGPPPPGLSFSNGVLSGTPTTAGAFNICLVLADTTGTSVTSTSPLTINEAPPPPPKLTLGGTLGDGKVGVPYSGQITASGGTGPYTYSGSGLPDGMTLSSSGGIGGTPGADGQFTFNASVTDSKGETASATFSIKILPADITILTSSLPNGVVGTPYSVTLSASGGNKNYTWTIGGLPDGLTATAAGVISGTPRTAGQSNVTVSVQDSTGSASARRTTLSLTILPATLVISTATLPDGTVGAAYSIALQTSGGTAPYSYSATGLPANLSISPAGVISGTPTAPGTSTIVVTVKDAPGAAVTKSFALSVSLPPAPPLNVSGGSDTSGPLQQVRLQVSLASPYPVDVVVTLTLTFAPDSGPDDPSIQFSSGGRTARITIPAGATSGATDVAIQTGSVAGLITITAQMQAAGQDVTPSPAPRRTIRIAAAAPVIVTGSVTAVRNATGFTVTLSGYVTDREMTQAIFTFSGSNLQTTTLTVNIDAMFSQYFGSVAAAATGSQFTFTQPFTVNGSTQSITSVTVTLVNRIGQSAPVTVNLN